MSHGMNLEGRILYLPLHMVKPGQPSRGRNTAQLQELAASISVVGVLQPLTVRKTGEHFTVVSGNRRLMAARMAGLGEVPCLLLELEIQDAELISLTENLQREDLHYFEEAELLQKYLCHSGLTQSQAAHRLGRSQSAIANKLRLLQHSPRVRSALWERGLSERHARELLRVSGETERLQVLEVFSKKHMSVAQAERYIDTYLKNRDNPGTGRYRMRDARLFLQRLDQDTRLLQSAGIPARMQSSQEGEDIVLTVRLPREVANN